MKKILTIILALTMVFALSVSVCAFEGSADVSLFAGNSVTWVDSVSDPVTVDHDGEYTLKLTGIDIDPESLTVLYIKDAAVASESAQATNLPANVQILTKSIKINGNAVELSDGYRTDLSSGTLDICWYNIWADSYMTVDGLANITDVEVVFEIITDGTAAATAPEEIASPAETATPTETAKPAETGITVAVLPMAIAMAAAAISKKR